MAVDFFSADVELRPGSEHSTLQLPTFGVCLRHLSVLRWKNSRTYRSPTGLHGGYTLATRVFLDSQHYIVFNSYNLVRVPRRLCGRIPHKGVERHCAFRSRAQPTAASALSAHTFWWAPLAMLQVTRCQLRSPMPPRSSHLLSSESAATSQVLLRRAHSPDPP